MSRAAVGFDAQDLANIATPGYAGQTLAWQAALAQAVKEGPQAVAHTAAQVVTEPGSLAPNGNAVSLEATMADLTQNQLLYETAAQAYQAAATTTQDVAKAP
jgi:flagellar basal body rod protein FlgB